MVPLGLFPALAATVTLILIQMNTGDCLGVGPIASNVHPHSVLADKQLFSRSSSRGRRSEKCGRGHYLHPNGTHCCLLCPIGTYVAQHCPSADWKTDCQPCPEGSFMDTQNFAEKCRGCQHCRSGGFRQVALTNCSTEQDTVCGCPSNHYRTSDSSDFFCNPCSTCQNGTVLKACSTSSDTICQCRKYFFLQTQKNSCSPCSSCREEECKEDCDGTIPSTSPPDPSVLTPILGSLVVVFAAACLLLTLRRFSKLPVQKKLVSAFSICPPVWQPSPADPQLPIHEVREIQVTGIPQESNQKEMLLLTAAVPEPTNTQRLPDCIPAAGETPIPVSPAVLYDVVDNVPFSQWKEFVRRLGLTDNTIARIQVEEWNMRDAQYKMLMYWKQQLGPRATVERICGVLNEMELRGCSEAIQEVLSRQA